VAAIHEIVGSWGVMMSYSLFNQLPNRLVDGPAVLASVMSCTGSTPRHPGAQMACGPDWFLGTIGGGFAESKVIDAAHEALRTGNQSEVTIDLRGTPAAARDGICGGTMLIRLDVLDQNDISRIQDAIEALASGRSLRQHFPPSSSWHLDITNHIEHPDDDHWIISPAPILLIVGGGHCGIALAHAAAPLGFQIIVHDDRQDIAPSRELPSGVTRAHQSISRTLAHVRNGHPLFAALVTRSYQHDLAVIEALSDRPLNYLGLMGSSRRIKQVRTLLHQGGLPETMIEMIDAPIGLDLPTETPEEIAISICARLIQARHNKSSEFIPAEWST
jgi:xanthine dehydrogenase accessory factor